MMSYAEKPEDITKEEWMEKLNNVHIQRADMNRLIMNYLVTGEFSSNTATVCETVGREDRLIRSCLSVSVLRLKRALKRQQKSFEWSLGLSRVWTWTLWMRG